MNKRLIILSTLFFSFPTESLACETVVKCQEKILEIQKSKIEEIDEISTRLANLEVKLKDHIFSSESKIEDVKDDTAFEIIPFEVEFPRGEYPESQFETLMPKSLGYCFLSGIHGSYGNSPGGAAARVQLVGENWVVNGYATNDSGRKIWGNCIKYPKKD